MTLFISYQQVMHSHVLYMYFTETVLLDTLLL